MRNRTISKLMVALTVAVCSLAFAGQASAIPLDQTSVQYLGLVNDGIPSNPAAEASYINTLLAQASPSGPTLVGTETYTRSANPCVGCPVATDTGATKDDTSPSNVIDVTGWTYLIGKYDAAQAGSLVWYVAGLTEATIPNTFNGHGLSHWSLYNPGTTTVPEPTTLLLLGSGLAALGVFGRRRFRK